MKKLWEWLKSWFSDKPEPAPIFRPHMVPPWPAVNRAMANLWDQGVYANDWVLLVAPGPLGPRDYPVSVTTDFGTASIQVSDDLKPGEWRVAPKREDWRVPLKLVDTSKGVKPHD